MAAAPAETKAAPGITAVWICPDGKIEEVTFSTDANIYDAVVKRNAVVGAVSQVRELECPSYCNGVIWLPVHENEPGEFGLSYNHRASHVFHGIVTSLYGHILITGHRTEEEDDEDDSDTEEKEKDEEPKPKQPSVQPPYESVTSAQFAAYEVARKAEMAEIEKKAKSLPGENMAVAAWSAGPGVILTSASPLIWSKTELSVPCEECDAQAVAPVIKVSAFGLELYYCPAHHPKLLL